ncbi:helix-turn-helix domain-containing protein [Candidatus Gottesmanbacteria bacterium]|nr:helix-turn-helix domain-containing protein [Candidatus Gottesmanbacteria bacterium]
MKTVGSIFRQAREKKRLTLDDVERATKIRKKFLSDIEQDDYTNLPSPAYAKGFVKNYSDFLGLDGTNVLAYFRRQTKEASKSSLLPKRVDAALAPAPLRMTPGRFLGLLVGALVIMFIGYLGLQYRTIQLPPALSIKSPKENVIANDERIEVLGTTDPDATVTINGVSVLVRSDGKFFDQVELDTGVNKITVIATSRFGKSRTIVREIGYQPD